jgi:hypothetical protein
MSNEDTGLTLDLALDPGLVSMGSHEVSKATVEQAGIPPAWVASV